MKVTVDKDLCIGCGMCIDICPEVFKYDDNNDKSEVIKNELTKDLEEKVMESKDICPVEAVIVE